MGGGSRPKLVHRPELVTRSDGRYEIRCSDCRGRSDEPVPIGIGLPVSSRVLALEMLRNHVGPAAWRTASHILPEPPRAATKGGAEPGAISRCSQAWPGRRSNGQSGEPNCLNDCRTGGR